MLTVRLGHHTTGVQIFQQLTVPRYIDGPAHNILRAQIFHQLLMIGQGIRSHLCKVITQFLHAQPLHQVNICLRGKVNR